MFKNFDFETFTKYASEASPCIILMCGVSGSGKTTFAKIIEKYGFVRLSIDETVYSTYGNCLFDFSPVEIDKIKNKAEQKLKLQLEDLIKDEQNAVIDFSFWNKTKRLEYKNFIEKMCGFLN